MSGPQAPLVVDGWTLFAHPLFLDQLEALIAEVEEQKRRDPLGYARRNSAKRLKAIADLVFAVIPADPARPEFRQGDTLGGDRKHWFRAKFFQQYRLFFRYRADSRIIVYSWVNDEDTRRAYDSRTDAYRTFRKMLARGNPPDDWDILLHEARAAADRLNAVSDRLGPV